MLPSSLRLADYYSVFGVCRRQIRSTEAAAGIDEFVSNRRNINFLLTYILSYLHRRTLLRVQIKLISNIYTNYSRVEPRTSIYLFIYLFIYYV